MGSKRQELLDLIATFGEEECHAALHIHRQAAPQLALKRAQAFAQLLGQALHNLHHDLNDSERAQDVAVRLLVAELLRKCSRIEAILDEL